MSVDFARYSRAELDHQLSPSRHAKDFMAVLTRHEAQTAALWTRPELEVRRDLRYGPAPRAVLDIVRPKTPEPVPCLVFVHGGFWQEGSKAWSGFAARAWAQAGWASALIGYSLAPQIRLRGIVAELGAALRFLARESGALGLDPARLVVAGHSAGAHLAAAVLCAKAGEEAAALVAGAALISGVYDLAPVAASYVNDAVGMDAEEVADLSVLAARPLRDVPVHLLVGADEPEAFRAQTAALQSAWAPLLPALSARRAPGRDHFDVLDDLADPASPSFRAVAEMGR